MQAINAGTQAFLDAKKIQGKDLTSRIKQYQLTIPNCKPTGHMLDCAGMLPPQDKQLWQSLVDKNKPFHTIFQKSEKIPKNTHFYPKNHVFHN